MNCDTPFSTPHSTNDFKATPQTPENNTVEVVPSKSIKDCTWTDILVSTEATLNVKNVEEIAVFSVNIHD